MGTYFKILLPVLSFGLFTLQLIAQKPTPTTATITFIAKEGDRAKTYIGQMKTGNIARLKFDLEQSRGLNNGTVNNYQTQDSRVGYVNKVTSSTSRKNLKNRKERAENDLIGHFSIKDTVDFEKIELKKQKALDKKYTTERNPGFFKKMFSPSNVKKDSYLSKNYKFTTKRIRNGQTFKKKAGIVSFVISFKIIENGYLNTYVNVVNAELIPGSAYYLKYHGTGSNRNYYLEYVPPTSR
ncbi:MAG: hypothetical protein JW798_18805 [Prolixibacteraceae bacterium]|nr:hypothetical protein [Prolixibacteraceae bacterium]